MQSTTERPTLFLRKASGVVKGFSPIDLLIYNFLAIAIISTGAMAFMQASGTYPRGNIIVALFLSAIIMTLACIAYSLLMSALVRSGGDYVFQSRILGGAIASATTIANYLFQSSISLAILGWFLAVQVLGPFLIVGGAIWNVTAMRDFGTWLATPLGVFLTTVVLIIWCAYAGAMGLGRFARIQRVCTWLGFGCAVIALGWLAFSSRDTFVSGFNNFMATKFNTPDAYNTVINNAKAAGMAQDFSFDWGQTIRLVPIVMFAMVWGLWGNPLGGEIRDNAGFRNRMIQTAGATWISAIMGAVIITIVLGVFGDSFIESAAWLNYNSLATSPLPITPFWGFFAMAMTDNPILIVATFLAFGAWLWVTSPNNTVGPSRPLMAMAMDRAAPAWLGKIGSKTHAPLNAIILISVVGVLWAVAFDWVPEVGRMTLSITILAVIMFSITCFAAALWPYLRPEMYNSTSAAKYKVGGIPLITISGLLFLPPAGFIIWSAITVSELGMAIIDGWLTNIGLFAFGLIFYYCFKIYRKSKESLDLSLTYKEIPPE